MRLTAKARTRHIGNAQGASIPAPIEGWDTVSPLANMDPKRAVALENWIPRPGWIELRRGYQLQSATAFNTSPFETLMAYNGSGSINHLFGILNGTVYNCDSAGAAATTVTGLTNSRAQHKMFSNNSDTQYLIFVNGADTPKIYDGVSWSDLSVSGSGVIPDNFVCLTSYKGRLWFVETDSTTPCYLDVGAITGTAHPFPLGSLMTKGGYVQAIGNWTIDTRQTVDEYLAFVTSRGQVIVYVGTDPSNPDDFTLTGVYDIGPPIGRRCLLRIAGDLLIICVDGVLPMSQMLSTDRAAANRSSVTSIIMNAMAQAAQNYKNLWGWQFIEYAKGTLAILNIPTVENQTQMQFCMNTLTGAWCKFTGINANCWEVDVSDNIYFGGNDGRVYKWDTGPSDYLSNITADVKTAFNYFGSRGNLKRWTLLQPLINSDGQVTPATGINVNFRSDAVLSTPETITSSGALWDAPTSTWDVTTWPPVDQQSPTWISITGVGQCASVETRVVSGYPNIGLLGLWGAALWGVDYWTVLATNNITLQLNGWNIVHEKSTGFV
jgi:hypothetical protein